MRFHNKNKYILSTLSIIDRIVRASVISKCSDRVSFFRTQSDFPLVVLRIYWLMYGFSGLFHFNALSATYSLSASDFPISRPLQSLLSIYRSPQMSNFVCAFVILWCQQFFSNFFRKSNVWALQKDNTRPLQSTAEQSKNC